jgi:hypothetical protein
VRYRAVNRELEQAQFVTGSRGAGPQLAAVVLLVALVVATVMLVVEGMR